METWAYYVGLFLCGLGGGLLLLFIIGYLGYAVCCAWVMFSDRFRDICRAESLIYEYRKNRHDFLIWQNIKDGDGNG